MVDETRRRVRGGENFTEKRQTQKCERSQIGGDKTARVGGVSHWVRYVHIAYISFFIQLTWGTEVIDLTHRPTVDLFRRWDQKEVAFIQLLRFIRISSANPGSIVISRPGKHHSMVESVEPSLADVEMIDS